MKIIVIVCGASALDVTTGENSVAEFYSREDDQIYALQEIYRYLLVKRPREIIINIVGVPDDNQDAYAQFLYDTLDLNRYNMIVIRYNEVPANYNKIEYQRAQLNKVFTMRENSTDAICVVNNDIIVQLDLDNISYGRISYMLLFQYCYEHNEKLLNKISYPDTQWVKENNRLILTHNAIVQLNMIYNDRSTISNCVRGRKKFQSLFDVINNTSTKMGRRKLLNYMYNPLTNVAELQTYK